jgi:hypothetical protein
MYENVMYEKRLTVNSSGGGLLRVIGLRSMATIMENMRALIANIDARIVGDIKSLLSVFARSIKYNAFIE